MAALEGKRVVPPYTEAVLILEGSATTSRGQVLEPMDFLLCGTGIEVLHFSKALAVLVEVRERHSLRE